MASAPSPPQNYHRMLIRFVAVLDGFAVGGAAAFDRCVLFALLYPVAAIFVAWAASGQAGPAEAALGLSPGQPLWLRVMTVGAMAGAALAYWRGSRGGGNRAIAWFLLALVFAIVAAVAFAMAPNSPFAVAAAVGLAFGGAVEVEFAGAYAVAGIVAGAVAVAAALPGKAAFGIAAAVAVTDIILEYYARRFRWRGRYLAAVTAILIAGCFLGAEKLAGSQGWDRAGPLLLFFGLFALLGAIGDWLALGVTRALMRRAIARGGVASFRLALYGGVAAIAVMALLAVAMLLGTEAFDRFAVLGGGKPVLAPAMVLDNIAADPVAPRNWWIYALLLQVAIPSVANLAIAAVSLMRGAPWLLGMFLNRVLADAPPGRRTVAVAAAQWALGIVLGSAAQTALAWLVARGIVLWSGADLVNVARRLLAYAAV